MFCNVCTWKQGNTGCCVWVIVCIMLSKKVCGRVCSVLLVLNSTGCTECCGFAPNRMLRHTPAGSGRQLLWSHARPLRRLAVTAAMAPATPHPDILCTTAYVSTDYLWPQPQPTFVPAEHQPASAMAWLPWRPPPWCRCRCRHRHGMCSGGCDSQHP